MNISRKSLSLLVGILPKMRFAQIVLASQLSGVELVSLLNIRTAGSIQRSIFAAPKVDKNVIEQSTNTMDAFNDYLRGLTSNKYLKKAKERLERSLSADVNKESFFEELESDKIATSGEDFNISSKEVKKFAKENDLNTEQTKLADAYVSLIRHEKGYLDVVISKIIANAAKSLTGDPDVKFFYHKTDDAINDIITTLQFGAKNNETPALETFLNSASYISANLIVSSIKIRSKNIAKNLKRNITGVNLKSFKKFLEESKEKNEDSQDIIEFLEKTNSFKNAPESSSKKTWKIFIDDRKLDSWIKEAFEQTWMNYLKNNNRKRKRTESINEPKKVERVEGSKFDDKNDEGLKFDDKLVKAQSLMMKKMKV